MSKSKIVNKTWPVISYCSLPDNIQQKVVEQVNGNATDCYIEYEVTPRHDQPDYDDDFTLDNWVILNIPELEGKTILIHLDY